MISKCANSLFYDIIEFVVASMILLPNSANPYRNTPHTVIALFVIGRFSRIHPFIDEGAKFDINLHRQDITEQKRT